MSNKNKQVASEIYFLAYMAMDDGCKYTTVEDLLQIGFNIERGDHYLQYACGQLRALKIALAKKFDLVKGSEEYISLAIEVYERAYGSIDKNETPHVSVLIVDEPLENRTMGFLDPDDRFEIGDPSHEVCTENINELRGTSCKT